MGIKLLNHSEVFYWHAEHGELYESRSDAFLRHAEYAELYESRSDAKFASNKFCDFCGFCVKQIASISIVVYNSMYSIHQIIHIEIDKQSDFLSGEFQIGSQLFVMNWI